MTCWYRLEQTIIGVALFGAVTMAAPLCAQTAAADDGGDTVAVAGAAAAAEYFSKNGVLLEYFVSGTGFG